MTIDNITNEVKFPRATVVADAERVAELLKVATDVLESFTVDAESYQPAKLRIAVDGSVRCLVAMLGQVVAL